MNREQEILARAINYVDDDMIITAHAPNKKLRHRIPALIAACLAVAIIVSFPYVRASADKLMSSEGAAPPGDAGNMNPAETGRPPFNFEGSEDPSIPPDPFRVCTFGGTTIQMTEWTETTATFTLKKTDSTPVYAAFLQTYTGDVLGCTEPDFRDHGTVVRPYVVRVYVDGGELQYELPTEPGEYEVMLDFSVVRRMSFVMMDGVMLYAYVGEEGAPVDEWLGMSGWDSLPPSESSQESDTETVAVTQTTSETEEEA